MHLLAKLFFRLILPIVLALALSIWCTFALLGQARLAPGSRLRWPYWYVDLRIFGIAAAAIFLIVFAVNLTKALKRGKEADEYAELLKEEQADEMKRRSEQDAE